MPTREVDSTTNAPVSLCVPFRVWLTVCALRLCADVDWLFAAFVLLLELLDGVVTVGGSGPCRGSNISTSSFHLRTGKWPGSQLPL